MRNFVIQLTESNREDLMRIFSCKVKFYNFEKYGSFYGYVENSFGCSSVAEIENTPIVDIETAKKLMSTNAIISKTNADLVRLKFEGDKLNEKYNQMTAKKTNFMETIASIQQNKQSWEEEFAPLIEYVKVNFLDAHPKLLTIERLQQLERNFLKWSVQLKLDKTENGISFKKYIDGRIEAIALLMS